jgi:hypothetical protein
MASPKILRDANLRENEQVVQLEWVVSVLLWLGFGIEQWEE